MRFPREKSIRHFRDQIRRLTRRNAPVSTQELIKQVNPVVRGWGHHYKRTSGSYACAGLGTTCRGRRREVLSFEAIWTCILKKSLRRRHIYRKLFGSSGILLPQKVLFERVAEDDESADRHNQ
jgi:hypothetical protein